MTSNLMSLDKFSCEGEQESLLRWMKWKRAFNIYLTAADINDDKTKIATLLHTGGLEFQEIFYNIPGLHEEKVYDTAITKLDNYFKPKHSIIYERHLFRSIKQEDGENFDKFLLKLRHQAERCMFSNADEHIICQITEKCKSNAFRKQILLLSNEEINLKKNHHGCKYTRGSKPPIK